MPAVKHTVKYLKSTSDAIKEITETRELTKTKAIRLKCLDCSGGSASEVRECIIPLCPLWPFRMGSKPAGRVDSTQTVIVSASKQRKKVSPYGLKAGETN